MRETQRTFYLIAFEALLCLGWLVAIPSESKDAALFGFSNLRLLAAALLLVAGLGSFGVALSLRREGHISSQLRSFLSGSPRWHILGTLLAFLLELGLLVSLVFLAVWIAIYPRNAPYFLRLSPLVSFLGLASAHLLLTIKIYHSVLWDLFGRQQFLFRSSGKAYKISLFVTLLLFLLVTVRYSQLAEGHARKVNMSYEFSDQKSYLQIAEKAHQTGFQYKGDRNRTPLYPHLLTLIYQPSESMLDFFQRGKQANILLSLFLSLGVFAFSRIFLGNIQAVLLTLVSLIGLFVYKAAYVQAELLYYYLSFVSYVLMACMLVRVSPWLSAAAGASAALAYLAKASMLPGVVVFLLVYVLQLLPRFRPLNGHDSSGTGKQFHRRKRALNLVIFLLVFLGLLSPYLLENKRLFGAFFYNVNSTFYAWYDNWEQVEAGTKAHGDSTGWPDMPVEQIPSMGKYLREHSLQQIQARFIQGFEAVWQTLVKPYGRFNYLAIYTLLLAALVFSGPRASLNLARRNMYLVLYALGFFSLYLLSFAWFAPVTGLLVARFVYGLYLPYLFSVWVVANGITGEIGWYKIGGRSLRASGLLWLVHAVVLVLVLYELVVFTPIRLADRWYGK